MCADMCADMWVDLCVDVRVPTCANMGVDVSVDVYVDMCVNMCMVMCMDICVDTCVAMRVVLSLQVQGFGAATYVTLQRQLGVSYCKETTLLVTIVSAHPSGNRHLHTHARARTHTHVRACVCVYAHIYAHVYPYVHTHIHMHIRTRIHTHTHTHTYTSLMPTSQDPWLALCNNYNDSNTLSIVHSLFRYAICLMVPLSLTRSCRVAVVPPILDDCDNDLRAIASSLGCVDSKPKLLY